jgi:hypothetical protein
MSCLQRIYWVFGASGTNVNAPASTSRLKKEVADEAEMGQKNVSKGVST